MTRQVISKVVNTKMKIEMLLMVGRSLKMVEIRDPAAASVALCDAFSSRGGNVEFSCVAEDGRVCGSPLTSRAMTVRAIAKVYSHILFSYLNCLLNVLYIEKIQYREGLQTRNVNNSWLTNGVWK